MQRTTRRLAQHLSGLIVFGALCAPTAVALAADINAVTGPVPGEVPVSAQCVATAPAAAGGLGFVAGTAARGLGASSAPSSRATVDGSAKVTQSWISCKGAIPRGVSASIEVTLPGLPSTAGNQGDTVQWGAGAHAQPPSPTLLK